MRFTVVAVAPARELEVDLPAACTVGALKAEIEARLGIPTAHQRVSWPRYFAPSDDELLSATFREGDRVHVFAHAGEGMLVIAKSLTGARYPLVVRPFDSVLSAKCALSGPEGPARIWQRLRFVFKPVGGVAEALKNNRQSLASCGVQDGCTVYVLLDAPRSPFTENHVC